MNVPKLGTILSKLKKSLKFNKNDGHKNHELLSFCKTFLKNLKEVKTVILKLSKKDPMVSFSFKNGSCEKLEDCVGQVFNYKNSLSFQYNFEQLLSKLKTTNMKNIITSQKHLFEQIFEELLSKTVSHSLKKYHLTEKVNIKNDLEGTSIFNMTNNPNIAKDAQAWIEKGKNFNPMVNISIEKLKLRFENEIKKIVERLLFKNDQVKVKWENDSIVMNIERILHKQYLYPETSKFLIGLSENYDEGCSKLIQDYGKKHCFNVNVKKLNETFEIPGYLFLEADKNTGYVLLSNDDIKIQYHKLNIKQKFTKVIIEENDYLRMIHNENMSAITRMPNELKKIVPYWLQRIGEPSSDASIGVLRLLPKVLKLKKVEFASLDKLTSRGIRAATADPLGKIEKMLHFIMKKMFTDLKKEYENVYEGKIPMICSTQEFTERFKTENKSTTGIHFETDVTDLYSCCTLDMIKDSIGFANNFVKFSDVTIQYIIDLLEIVMRNSYFKEPDGIYECDDGLSMGSHHSAVAADFVLFTSEYKSRSMLSNFNKMQYVHRFYRLRDDFLLKLLGGKQDVMEILHIIFSSYPVGLEFNVTTNVIFSKFLDCRIISQPQHNVDTLTILRKSPCKFDIIRQTSNTSKRYKKSAINHYINRIKNVCNTNPERYRQKTVSKLILSYKGYNGPLKVQKSQNKFIHNKKFLTTIIHDEVTNSHIAIKNLLKISRFPDKSFYYPVDVPGRKIRQFVFTKKKLVRSIWPN